MRKGPVEVSRRVLAEEVDPLSARQPQCFGDEFSAQPLAPSSDIDGKGGEKCLELTIAEQLGEAHDMVRIGGHDSGNAGCCQQAGRPFWIRRERGPALDDAEPENLVEVARLKASDLWHLSMVP